MEYKKITNNGGTECTLCSKPLSGHTHLLKAFIQHEGELTRVCGFFCCSCTSRVASAQVPSPHKEESGQNNIKESAPVPFTPRIDWGDFNSLVYFKKLTDKVNKSNQSYEARQARGQAAQEKAW